MEILYYLLIQSFSLKTEPEKLGEFTSVFPAKILRYENLRMRNASK
ncbi:hypothetical protein NSP_46040 [Nodularia spumigena CCY9414]|nr:hypothetical protein NSP_46040 [Nodularia spumigena CCY9414]